MPLYLMLVSGGSPLACHHGTELRAEPVQLLNPPAASQLETVQAAKGTGNSQSTTAISNL